MAHRVRITTKIAKKTLCLSSSQCRRVSSYFQPSESEYVDQPVYPPIVDLSEPAVRARNVEAAAQKITSLTTVEEKLIELNKPKYYGWRACQLFESNIPFNILPFVRFATRTCLTPGLPPSYKELEVAAEKFLPIVKGPLSDLILQEFGCIPPRTNVHNQIKSAATEEDRLTRNFTPQLNRLLTSLLAPKNEHLVSTEVDFQPRVEAYWSLGGIEPDKMLRKIREKNEFFKRDIEEPVDRPIQYYGKPCLTLRHQNPLPALLDRDSGLSVEGSIPEWKLDPRVLGYHYKHCRSVVTPGFWPGTELQHGYLAYLQRGHMKIRDDLLKNRDHQEGLDSQALLHSFAWCMGQACYLGFGPFTELTYPITTQTIITNGQQYSFYAYQMNTCALYSNHSGNANPHRNVCFGTEEMKLFDLVEQDQVKGFNDDVLKKLIAFYLVQPVEPAIELRPYLSPERYIGNVTDVNRRIKVENDFKFLMSNRPRHALKDEIMLWEKIYKIDHKTRPMDPRRRFFERLEPGPGARKLDDFDPPYIPRAIRGKKSRRGRPPVQPTVKI